MKKQTSLKTIFYISIAGVLFSGYLSFTELFKQFCALGAGTCTNVFRIPACVYGFVMYAVVLIISAIGLMGKK